MVITVDCPSCATSFPVDTNKVPEGGVNARCSECSAIFRVERPAESVVEPIEVTVASAVAEAVAEPEVTEPEAEAFEEAVEPEVAEPEAEAVQEVAEPEVADEIAFEEAAPQTPEEPTAEAGFAYGDQDAAVEVSVAYGDEDAAVEVSPAFGEDEAAVEASLTVGDEEAVIETFPAYGDDDAGIGLSGVEAIEEHVIEEVLEEEAEAPTPEEPTGQADGTDWGALRELLEDVGVGSDTGEVVVEEEAPPTTEALAEEGEPGPLHAVEEAVAEAVGDDIAPTHAEVVEEAAEIVEPDVAATDAPTAGSDMVWDVDRDVETAAEEVKPSSSPGWFTFARQDPADKARRLARVLVSDMVMYNPERHDRALNNGTLKEDFEDEIRKSWREYVEQVGEDMATSTTYWSEALNELLAKGQQIF